MTLLVGGVTGYAIFATSKNSHKKVLSTTKIAQTDATSESTLRTSNEQSTVQGQNSDSLSVNSGQSGIGLQGNLGQSSNTNSNNTQKLPGPESFGQYDQYSTATTAMFAEPVVGTGKAATQGKKVAVIYQGWLTNGQLFDQSKTNDQGQLEPFIFTLGGNQVIQGWEQGIAGMKVGGQRRLIIPPSVGYGDQVQGPIPPNSVLVFDVQLVDAE